MLEEYFKEVNEFNPLSRELEREVIKKAKAGDTKAFNLIIESNLKFVISIARAYQGQGISLDDLICEGNLGLLKAFDRFNLVKNVKFISYAVWWIRQGILNAIHENAKSIRIPQNKISNVSKIDKARNDLAAELGRTPSYEEIEAYLDFPEILADQKYSYTMLELDKPQTENNKNLEEIIPAEQDPEEELNRAEFLIELDSAISDFSDREKLIIKMYHGIGYPRTYTLKDIGDELGLTRERIRQIKKKALEKLKLKHRSKELRSYL